MKVLSLVLVLMSAGAMAESMPNPGPQPLLVKCQPQAKQAIAAVDAIGWGSDKNKPVVQEQTRTSDGLETYKVFVTFSSQYYFVNLHQDLRSGSCILDKVMNQLGTYNVGPGDASRFPTKCQAQALEAATDVDGIGWGDANDNSKPSVLTSFRTTDGIESYKIYIPYSGQYYFVNLHQDSKSQSCIIDQVMNQFGSYNN